MIEILRITNRVVEAIVFIRTIVKPRSPPAWPAEETAATINNEDDVDDPFAW